MSANASAVAVSPRVATCKQWYSAFKNRRLDDLMALFDDDPRVCIGSGGSGSVVPYAGTFEGCENVRWYYQMRFAQPSDADRAATEPLDPRRSMRPFCMMPTAPLEYANWVILRADMKDHKGISAYEGPYVHVFGFRGTAVRVASLDMYFAR